MSASRSGPLYSSGFQQVLTDLLVRLSINHPYHTLYQLFALKNGQLGSNGKIQEGSVHGVVSHSVDVDKVTPSDLMISMSQHCFGTIQQLFHIDFHSRT